MALKDAIAKKRENEQRTGINHRPEIDAKIDKFIAENPEVYAKLQEYTKEEMIRKRILDMVTANERRQGYSTEMREFVEQNPSLKQEVDRRLKRIPEDQRERAYARIANSVITSHSMRQGAATPQPY
jgi:hypothetical protein